MTASQLIGRVAASYLQGQLSSDGDGTARFIVDCLPSDQTAAMARAILDSSQLRDQVDIKLPASFLAAEGLPASILTAERATFYRNADCSKAALLVANTGDDEEQSLRDLTPIGVSQLQSHPEIWVTIAGEGLPINSEHRSWWEKALVGLRDLSFVSLERFAQYVLDVRVAVEAEGLAVVAALGYALPALRVPRDSFYFDSINPKLRSHASRWKRLYASAQRSRACFLSKQTPSGLLLNEDELRTSWEKVQDAIPEECHEAIEAFIAAPTGWNAESDALAVFEWELIKPLFDGLRREKFNLGKATFDFYDERDMDLLVDDEREYLERLSSRKATSPDEDDVAFYEAHRTELKDDRKLKSAWDRFIFGTPRECEDFITGLALCLEALFDQDTPAASRKLTIRCDSRSKKDFRGLNVDAGRYFARRYRGIDKLLGKLVKWDVGALFEFESLEGEFRAKGTTNHSESKAALQLRFIVELECALPNGGTEVYSKQLTWIYNPKAVSSQFVSDWDRLLDHPIVLCRTDREQTSGRGQFQSVDLRNVRTLVPAYDRDRGSFVAVYKKQNDLTSTWRSNLNEAQSKGFITPAVADALGGRFDAFSTSYATALRSFALEGISHPSLHGQLAAYADLLTEVCSSARGDHNRKHLLQPLLRIGTVDVGGGSRTTAIIAPWHPLRLSAISRKAQFAGNLVKRLLSAEEVHFGDTRLFFRDLKEELEHPFYPEIALGWYEEKPELLSLSDSIGDYSLHESPTASDQPNGETNENPALAANLVLDLVGRYLSLHPHEQANLSVVLYNCDSARLPQAVVDKIGESHEDDEDVRCQVVLRHRDGGRLRSLYERIVETSDGDSDSFNASEATRDFMARLRISIMADQAPVPDPKDGRPTDIVFSQDVISRHARVEWYVVDATPVAPDALMPSAWSRRRPAARDDLKSVVYLCCPVQSADCWAYTTALASLVRGTDWDGNSAKRLLPARQLDFRDPDTSHIFRETHDLGNWVVNYDELLDRRQLLNQHVRVIRYKQFATQGRNLIISSKAPLGLLRSMITNRLRFLDLGLDDYQLEDLTNRLIEDANDISGDIVLRAAKRGRNANELIGIVLSRFIVRQELGTSRHFGWYFLDDYADWLGQREEQIADMLTMSPETMLDGRLRLALAVTESKYIDYSGLSAKRKESQKQLRDTMKRISDALFGDPARLDRSLWLSRLSDLVLDGLIYSAGDNVDPERWRRAIREGDCEICLRGYSHVFVSGPTSSPECSERAVIAGLEDSYQEVFGRATLRQLVVSYYDNENPIGIRRDIAGDDTPWTGASYLQPSVLDEEPASDNTGFASCDVAATNTSSDELASADPGSGAGGVAESGDCSDVATDEPPRMGWSSQEIALLVRQAGSSASVREEDAAWLKQVENRTKSALQQFQLQAKLVSSALTPNAALLRFAGSANLTVEQVIKRRSELLTTHSLNVVAVQPEPGVVAISIERPQRQVVPLLDAWRRWSPTSVLGNQDILIGVRETDGELLFLSPGNSHAPHTLIAGSTGSGKSVLMQDILLGISATNTPEHARIILIDPKQGVDYFSFEGLPHLDGGVIDSQALALNKLEQLVHEMDQRYTKLRAAKVPNLRAFNQKVEKSQRLPYIWLVHDEFAEWMLTEDYKSSVASIVGRLGVKARAAGIYLLFAAQRPDANVMPMQLRDNLGNRLILRVASEGTSEIALGERGAERLLGKGHLLAKLEGEQSLVYAQVPYVEPEMLDTLVSAIVGG